MKLSTKGRYAVMALADLACQSKGQPVALADIAARQEISLSYLEQLFGKLRKGAQVKSVRGPGGGYNLAKSYADISVSEIISAVDEQIDATQCGGNENCKDEGRCMTHDLWTALNTKILEYLDGVTLADMVASQKNGHKINIMPRSSAISTAAASHEAVA